MKKLYQMPEYEVVDFENSEMIIASGCESFCESDEQCRFCYYLVCEPQDVIIGS